MPQSESSWAGRRRWVSIAVIVVVAAAAAMAATAAVDRGRHQAGAHRKLLRLHASALGSILVAASGRTLYVYSADRKGKSACYGGCAAAWPPLLTRTRKITVGPGLRKRLVGVTKRKNGTLQVTYRKHPLYRFAGDKKSGELKGQGYAHRWYVLSASGRVIKKMPAASSTKTTTTTPPATTTTSGGSAWG